MSVDSLFEAFKRGEILTAADLRQLVQEVVAETLTAGQGLGLLHTSGGTALAQLEDTHVPLAKTTAFVSRVGNVGKYTVSEIDPENWSTTHLTTLSAYALDNGSTLANGTTGLLGRSCMGERWFLPIVSGGDEYNGEWYWFQSASSITADSTNRLIPRLNHNSDFYAEFGAAGKITGCRAWVDGAITDGTITVYPAKGSQADTRADGDVDTWTDGTDSLVLSAGVSSNRATGWTQLSLAAGEALGCKVVADEDLAASGIYIIAGLRFTPD